MGSRPLVTIITPSLNQGRFIGETVSSVLAQSYPHVDYLVLDAGSTDETHDVLAKFGDRVRWRVAPDKGQADAINKGWKAARGEVLAWLNADDLLEPGAVAAAVDALATRPDAAAVYGDAVEFHEDGRECKTPLTAPFHLWRLINVFDYITQPATFFRRTAVERVGWLDEDLHYGMDWDLLIRLGLRSPLIYLPEVLARARIHSGAKTSIGGRPRLRELVRVMRRYSNERRPPAFWFYATSTYLQQAERTATKLRPRGAAAGFERLAWRAYDFVAQRTFLAVDDWFPDGWVGPDTHFLVPPTGRLRLRGEVPSELAPQTLRVDAAGQRVYQDVLSAGPFDLTLDTPVGYSSVALPVEIHARRWQRMPHPMGTTRRVAYRLTSIDRA